MSDISQRKEKDLFWLLFSQVLIHGMVEQRRHGSPEIETRNIGRGQDR
jgi:hypothetical protein